MILSNGDNQYKNNEFSFWTWSAPVLQTPEEVVEKVKELKLEGRVIKDVIAIGLGYNWGDDDILCRVDHQHEQMHPVLKERITFEEAPFSPEISLNRDATIDEPLLIVFEDGDVLGISFDEGSSVRMELNTIPVTIQPGINRKNFHANRLFGDLIGKTISEIVVNATSAEPEFTWSHGMDLAEQPFYISSIVFVCQNAEKQYERFGLRFQAWLDYGEVELLDICGDAVKIPMTEVPQIVEGYPAEEIFKKANKPPFLEKLRKRLGKNR